MIPRKVMTFEKIKNTPDVFTVDELTDLFELDPYDDREGVGRGNTYYDHLEEYEMDDRTIHELSYKHSAILEAHWNGHFYELRMDCPECDGEGEIESELDPGSYRDCEHCDQGKISYDRPFELAEEMPEFEEEIDRIRNEIADDHYKRWVCALEATADWYLEKIGLVTMRVEVHYKPYWSRNSEGKKVFIKPAPGIAFKIQPELKFRKDNPQKHQWVRQWKSAATALLEVIEGVGYFGWDGDVKRFITEESCASYKDAVLSHLHWLKWYGDVYGDIKPERKFANEWENQMRNW